MRETLETLLAVLDKTSPDGVLVPGLEGNPALAQSISIGSKDMISVSWSHTGAAA